MIDRIRIHRRTSVWITGVCALIELGMAIGQWTTGNLVFMYSCLAVLAVTFVAFFWPKKEPSISALIREQQDWLRQNKGNTGIPEQHSGS